MPASTPGWATVALQLLVNYKSHHASAFGSHACNSVFAMPHGTCSSTTAGGPQLSTPALVKHSQHTVNSLIVPHVNPFLPSAISTMSVLFFLALISDTISVPPVSECPPQ
ncbi:unnamed protein product, partial [Staurois parvus]